MHLNQNNNSVCDQTTNTSTQTSTSTHKCMLYRHDKQPDDTHTPKDEKELVLMSSKVESLDEKEVLEYRGCNAARARARENFRVKSWLAFLLPACTVLVCMREICRLKGFLHYRVHIFCGIFCFSANPCVQRAARRATTKSAPIAGRRAAPPAAVGASCGSDGDPHSCCKGSGVCLLLGARWAGVLARASQRQSGSASEKTQANRRVRVAVRGADASKWRRDCAHSCKNRHI